jgi:hypothetical protein
VIELALFVIAYFKDDAVKPLTHPADRTMLFRQIGTIVLVVGMGEELQNFLKPDPTFQIAPQPLTLAPIKVKPHPESITVIPWSRLAARIPLTDGPDWTFIPRRDVPLRSMLPGLVSWPDFSGVAGLQELSALLEQDGDNNLVTNNLVTRT